LFLGKRVGAYVMSTVAVGVTAAVVVVAVLLLAALGLSLRIIQQA
jgi:hypothetical protein